MDLKLAAAKAQPIKHPQIVILDSAAPAVKNRIEPGSGVLRTRKMLSAEQSLNGLGQTQSTWGAWHNPDSL